MRIRIITWKMNLKVCWLFIQWTWKLQMINLFKKQQVRISEWYEDLRILFSQIKLSKNDWSKEQVRESHYAIVILILWHISCETKICNQRVVISYSYRVNCSLLCHWNKWENNCLAEGFSIQNPGFFVVDSKIMWIL